jgi:methylated-DNA-[protein]-cysteine S-methyltransferase
MFYDYFETDAAGTLLLAGDDSGLRHLNFVNGKHPIKAQRSWHRDATRFEAVKSQLAAYFAGDRR